MDFCGGKCILGNVSDGGYKLSAPLLYRLFCVFYCYERLGGVECTKLQKSLATVMKRLQIKKIVWPILFLKFMMGIKS